MIKHIVMWKLKEMEIHKKEIIQKKIKTELENLNGKIEGLISIEVGIDFLQSESSYDIVLYSILGNRGDLEQYQKNPLHVKVANETVKPFVQSRIVVDYEF